MGLLLLALLLGFTAAQSNSFDANSVNQTTRNQWCQAEVANCPLLCGGVVSTADNTCDTSSLDYTCTCTDGLAPANIIGYQGTVPIYECEEEYQQCVAQSNSKSCTQCGTLQPSDVGQNSAATSASISSASPTATTSHKAATSTTTKRNPTTSSAITSAIACAAPAAQSGFTGPVSLKGAIDDPDNETYVTVAFQNGSSLDVAFCAQQCRETTAFNRDLPATDGTYKPCNFFNAYVGPDGTYPDGTHCAQYTKTYSSPDDTTTTGVSCSYGYSLITPDSGKTKTNQPSTSTSSSLSSSAKIGVGVGISLGVCLVGITACLLWLRQRRKRCYQDDGAEKNGSAVAPMMEELDGDGTGVGTPVRELDGQEPPPYSRELQGSLGQRYELA